MKVVREMGSERRTLRSLLVRVKVVSAYIGETFSSLNCGRKAIPREDRTKRLFQAEKPRVLHTQNMYEAYEAVGTPFEKGVRLFLSQGRKVLLPLSKDPYEQSPWCIEAERQV